MTDSTRTELFRVLEKLSSHYPHWRIGQLVANMAGIADVNIWDVEDKQLLAAAQDYLEHRSPSNGDDDTEPLEKVSTDQISNEPSTTDCGAE